MRPDRDWSKLHSAFSGRLKRWIAQAEAEFPQFAFRLGEGRRTEARQRWLYASGRTRPGPILTNTMDSRHRVGLAGDMYVVRRSFPLKAVWDGRVWRAIYEKVPPEKYGLRCLEWEFVHLEHAESDRLIAIGKPIGIYKT